MDIEVKHEYDLDRNERIVIIHNDKVNNSNLDIISSKDKNFSYMHMVYMKEYLKNNCIDDELINKYSDNLDNSFIIFYLMITNYNDLIFTETTKDNSKERYGMLYLPNKISIDQKQSFDVLKERLRNFNELYIISGLGLKDGFISNNIQEIIKGSDIDKVDKIIEIEQEKNKI